jgi:hypothetical protein
VISYVVPREVRRRLCIYVSSGAVSKYGRSYILLVYRRLPSPGTAQLAQHTWHTAHLAQHTWHSCHSALGTPQLAQHSWHSTPGTQHTWHTAHLAQHIWHSTLGTAQLAQHSCHSTFGTFGTAFLAQHTWHSTVGTGHLACLLSINFAYIVTKKTKLSSSSKIISLCVVVLFVLKHFCDTLLP